MNGNVESDKCGKLVIFFRCDVPVMPVKSIPDKVFH